MNDVERNQNSPPTNIQCQNFIDLLSSLQPTQCGTHALQDNEISSIDLNT